MSRLVENVYAILDKVAKLVEDISVRERAFIDVRIEISDTLFIERTSESLRVRCGTDQGAAIRAFCRGTFGFTSTTNVTIEGIREGIERALKIAKVREGELKIRLLDPRRDEVVPRLRKDFREIEPEVKVRDLETYYRLLREKCSTLLRSAVVYYRDLYWSKFYISSEGRVLRQDYAYTWLYTWLTGGEGGTITSVRDERGTRDGYTLWDKWSPEKLAERVAKRLDGQVRGRPPRAGRFPVVMAPEVVGVFVHEVFGHLAEADIAMSGSIVKDRLGQRVGSELVNIVDDPQVEEGFGTYMYDDEGVEARRAVLVERGVAKEFMVDRVYSAMLNIEPTGNARAESFRVSPLIRMRNTLMLPGDATLDELFEDIEFGYYLVSFRGGQANLDGTFQVGIQEAYEIVKGEVRDPVKNMSISGNLLEVLSKVSAVGKDFDLEYGRCGKGQIAYVSSGGPHIKVDEVIIGGYA